ncbi:restriction endonuclease subunit R [Firmicutes bacterium AM59-13]|jgi:type III restriction enzyme|nr:restriction endonuclease subunit R [Firmicutes bacterium AM59-13]
MKAELFPFQKKALSQLRLMAGEAIHGYQRTHANQVVSFTAPTGAGKTIIMASLIEEIFFGGVEYEEQPEAIFVWLSDSPQLNEQSKDKIDLKADRILLGQCVTISDDSFDQEMLDEGHIYFLNTQKLGKNSNLTKHSDERQYTIWETLANTAREKSDRLYIIIDEAHRGMQGREAGRATTIMQKFLKGSPDDGLEPMPVVIGMSATIARFNVLVSGIVATTYPVVVTTDEVRASGLLKDRIVISYPEENSGNRDMAVLQAAADEWKDKWEHWYQYCFEQHYAYVNPILVIQVQNSTGDNVSATDLNDCIQKIEERCNIRFQEGEVVHTFGQTNAALIVNGLTVPYVEPAAISEDKRIKVVFFKESLSTGWDCPRAETMMSFRRATDATYIAQLLGRMIRTPMQMHIQVDDTLNDVHLYLPYFDAGTVKDVVQALQDAEGGDIPADIYGESLDSRVMDTLSVRPRTTSTQRHHVTQQTPGQMNMFQFSGNDNISNASALHEDSHYVPSGQVETNGMQTQSATNNEMNRSTAKSSNNGANTSATYVYNTVTSSGVTVADSLQMQTNISEFCEVNGTEVNSSENEAIDREGVMKAINDSGLLTYDVRSVKISNYLNSLYALARLLVQSGKYEKAKDDVLEEIVKQIREYAMDLRRTGKYDEMAKQIMEFEMKTQIFDAFGQSVDDNIIYHFMSSTDTDIDRQFRKAESKLGNEGVANKYGRYFYDEDDPNAYKIDVILYAADDDCTEKLQAYAEKMFHELNDKYRRKMVNMEERFIKQYNTIVSDGDIVSKHNFRLPEIIQQPRDVNGKEYTDHLFVDDSGVARINLNSWEEGVLKEEQAQPDYVCWLRNPPRKAWSLCIPYEMRGEQKPTYPDFLIVRRDNDGEYVIDILEPHDPTRIDNLGKAKGFAEYARQNPGVGRIELIRKGKDGTGHERFKRLDMARSAIRDKVSHVMTNDELDHIFDTDGKFIN